jgi:hypothetical protein
LFIIHRSEEEQIMHGTLKSKLGDLSRDYYEAATFGKFADVANALIARDYPSGAKIPFGPCSEDEENGNATIYLLGRKEVLEGATLNLILAGEPVLDLRLFMPKLMELWSTWVEQDSKSHRHEYCEPLLEDFYVRVASGPHILGGYFLGGSRLFKGPKRLSHLFEKKKEIITLPRNYYISPSKT